jgi:S-adenosylmethionine:diacylglycerol 3-amino-3-carboxypropyl transferase
MSVKSQDQVELFDLLFGMNWEDPESDRRALAIQPGETVTTISSGGCNLSITHKLHTKDET